MAQWNSSNWVCATVSGGGTETDPVWTAFQGAGGTVTGTITSAGASPGYAYTNTGSSHVYTTTSSVSSVSGSSYSDWELYWSEPGVGGGLLMEWDGYENRLSVGGTGIITSGTFTGNGSGLTNVSATDPTWTTFKTSGGTITGDVTLGGQQTPGILLDPSTSTVGFSLSAFGYSLSGVDYSDLSLGRYSSFGGGTIMEYDDTTSVWDFTGSLSSDCPPNTDEASGWCIENLGAGSSSVPAAATWGTAVADCDGKGMQLCPVAALMACDQLEPTTTGCEDATDGTGGTYDLWTADVQVPTGGGSAFSNLVTYGSNNTVDLEPESNSNNWLCCTPVYSP